MSALSAKTSATMRASENADSDDPVADDEGVPGDCVAKDETDDIVDSARGPPWAAHRDLGSPDLLDDPGRKCYDMACNLLRKNGAFAAQISKLQGVFPGVIRWVSSGLGVIRWVSSGLGVIRWVLSPLESPSSKESFQM